MRKSDVADEDIHIHPTIIA